MDKLIAWLTPARRRRLYAALLPVFAILIAHGLVTAEDAGNVIESLGYVLGIGAVGLARKHVPTEDTPESE